MNLSLPVDFIVEGVLGLLLAATLYCCWNLERRLKNLRADQDELTGTIRALGLDRIGHSNLLPDNPAVRGMIRQVHFLVEVAEATPAEVQAASSVTAAKVARKAKVAK